MGVWRRTEDPELPSKEEHFFEDGMFGFGKKTKENEAIARVYQEQAQVIVKNEEKAREIVKERERNFVDKMHGMMTRFVQIDTEIQANSTALTSTKSLLDHVKDLFAADPNKEKIKKHEKLLNAMVSLNEETWGDGAYKYTSRFSPPDGFQLPSVEYKDPWIVTGASAQRQAEDHSRNIRLLWWRAIAEREMGSLAENYKGNEEE